MWRPLVGERRGDGGEHQSNQDKTGQRLPPPPNADDDAGDQQRQGRDQQLPSEAGALSQVGIPTHEEEAGAEVGSHVAGEATHHRPERRVPGGDADGVEVKGQLAGVAHRPEGEEKVGGEHRHDEGVEAPEQPPSAEAEDHGRGEEGSLQPPHRVGEHTDGEGQAGEAKPPATGGLLRGPREAPEHHGKARHHRRDLERHPAQEGQPRVGPRDQQGGQRHPLGAGGPAGETGQGDGGEDSEQRGWRPDHRRGEAEEPDKGDEGVDVDGVLPLPEGLEEEGKGRPVLVHPEVGDGPGVVADRDLIRVEPGGGGAQPDQVADGERADDGSKGEHPAVAEHDPPQPGARSRLRRRRRRGRRRVGGHGSRRYQRDRRGGASRR